MLYNWQWSNWPNFSFETSEFEAELLAFNDKSGQTDGLLRGLTVEERAETIAQTLALEALKSAEISGQYLAYADLASSIRAQLGLNASAEAFRDRAAEGAGELAVAAHASWNDPLQETMLFTWHHILMKGTSRLTSGKWREGSGPKQVTTSLQGKRKIHFEAPPSEKVPTEMARLIDWYNQSRQTLLSPPLRAAIALLYFESILPFEDGNGRIGRALAAKAISQSLGRPAVLSLSTVIESNKARYFAELDSARQTYEITSWVRYFLSVALDAQAQAERQIDLTLRKSRFRIHYRPLCSDRQWTVVKQMLEQVSGADSEEHTTARGYLESTGVSKATATRDLQDLASKGALSLIGSGRGARYELNL